VPEPRTVILSGAEGMAKLDCAAAAHEVNPDPATLKRNLNTELRARFRFGLSGLRRDGLVNFEIGHFQLAQQVQQ
jgi:hypothetical protein